MSKKIKQLPYTGFPKYKETLENNKDIISFSFHYMLNSNIDYAMQSRFATKESKIKLLDSIKFYSSLTWSSVTSKSKYESGVEQIARDELRSLKVSIPNEEFYNEIKEFCIFRVTKKHRMCGYRVKNVCYILWIDWNLTSYDHG